jgi:GT2 family glycosyltransferase/glycosyltransferase involved in cell wall biosynthesis
MHQHMIHRVTAFARRHPLLLRTLKRAVPLRLRNWIRQENSEVHDAGLPVQYNGLRPGEGPVISPKYDVVCFANIDWSARFQRPQQTMLQFAKNGHRVFYVTGSRTCRHSGKFSVTEVAPSVFVVALHFAVLQDIYHAHLREDNKASLLESIAALCRAYRIKTAVAIVHLPFWTALAVALRQSRGWRIAYDCMDEWSEFPGIGQPFLDDEIALIEAADLVFVTGNLLLKKWKAHKDNCVLVRNGVDFEFFSKACAPNSLLAGIESPIIGFYGAIADWIDLELVSRLSTLRPQWAFVLVGDVFVDSLLDLKTRPNVHLLGRRPYVDMPRYLYRFDVCLVPFKLNRVTHAVDPVKLYEYISVGKPVVSAPLQELSIYGSFLYFADGADDFVSKIEMALRERHDLTKISERIALARNNDWAERFASMDRRLVDLFRRVTIIVVTFENSTVTKDCIDSILRNTAYPNYEIVIVDNGSRDDTVNYLIYLSRVHENIRIILNDDNRGFAAANNQGLAAATGDIFVLLNNDTVVPRGWLDELVKYLDNSHIGLVGPVTNFVGNEAKVVADYKTMAEMEDFSDKRTERFHRQTFPIKVLAMYCVAMRRDTFVAVGPLDEAFGIGMFEDDDYSNRVREKGLAVLCAEDVFVHHIGQASFRKLISSGAYDELWQRNKAHYERKWGGWSPHKYREDGSS